MSLNPPMTETQDDLGAEWHGFATEEPSDPDFFIAPADETDNSRVLDWQEIADKRPAKRKLSKKSRKEHFVGKHNSSRGPRKTKQKGKKRHERVPKENITHDDTHYMENDEDSAIRSGTVDSGPLSSAKPDNSAVSLLRDALLAEVEKSWNEVAISLNANSKQYIHNLTGVNSNQACKPMLVLRQNVKAHFRKLLFGYNLSGREKIMIPWSTLGLWLYDRKKRLINWDTTPPFDLVNYAFLSLLSRPGLCKMLLVDLVNWTKDEIKYGTSEIPLVVDSRGRAVVKVGDLPRLYHDSPVALRKRGILSNDEGTESQYESESSTTNNSSCSSTASSSSPSSPSSGSDDSSSTLFSQTKPERREYSSRKSARSKRLVSDSDDEGDSDTESE